jgi:hypothetical protein
MLGCCVDVLVTSAAQVDDNLSSWSDCRAQLLQMMTDGLLNMTTTTTVIMVITVIII